MFCESESRDFITALANNPLSKLLSKSTTKMIQLAGSLGILVLIALIGLGIGVGIGLYMAKQWLAKNGCYTCDEGFRYKFGFGEEDDN